MQPDLVNKLSAQLNEPIKSATPVSGGDISDAYFLTTSNAKNYFCKVNSTASADALFKAEVNGLTEIAKSNTLRTPEIIATGSTSNHSFLLLEFIHSKKANDAEMRVFGEQLAQMHQTYSDSFGWDESNFIGSLPQFNKKHKDWTEFYLLERLAPQLKMARDNGALKSNEIPSEDRIWNGLNQLFPEVKPSLLHGDLWSGNFLISSNGTPYLIDPATYFGHYEVDLAMSNLFGGFTKTFFEGHAGFFTPEPEFEARIDIYQLYYLLVHLNLFGGSYYQSVSRILKRYF